MTPDWSSLTARAGFRPSLITLAQRLAGLYPPVDPAIVLATASVLRCLELGSICFDPADPASLGLPADATDVIWPKPRRWYDALAASPMVFSAGVRTNQALVLDDGRLYLTRHWLEQAAVADRLVGLAGPTTIRPATIGPVTMGPVTMGPVTMGPATTHPAAPAWTGSDLDLDPDQAGAVRLAAAQRCCCVVGGPGTGKTRTVAAILADLAGRGVRRVALTAPTGRAAANLEQAVSQALPGGNQLSLTSGTLHRLLGAKPWGDVDHDADQPLVADVIVVDEASMVPLHLMRQLLDAVAPTSRLILVGDPNQLPSVEAGTVLADIVAADGVVPVATLTVDHRFGQTTALARVAQLIRQLPDQAVDAAAVDAILDCLGSDPDHIDWIKQDVTARDFRPDDLEGLRQMVVDQGLGLIDAAAVGDGAGALAWLERHRLLVAHRQGPAGVERWTGLAEAWIDRARPGAMAGLWPVGRPLLVTRNDSLLEVVNGDAGVIVAQEGQARLALRHGQDLRYVPPDLVDTSPLYASTIHKAQGGQYDAVCVIVPPPDAAILSRQLFYTAVTRTRRHLRVIGGPQAVRQALMTSVTRASGLTPALRRRAAQA